MDIKTSKKGIATVVMVSGRMDAVTAPDFEKRCSELIDSGDLALAIDLENLEYISSAGLRSILATGKKIKGAGGQIVFCSLAGMVKEVFDISGFASIFPVYGTQDEAVAKLG
ncbi:MAG: anti-sigma factor antagonist [Deltaproteobacteria bacterium]|nr:anti-sigma factor antagonist [Deltaproteobacteria bacterium]